MTSPASTVTKARCVVCRADVTVPDAYTHGDQVKCGTCGTAHRIVRGDRLRLVMADTAGLREELHVAEARVAELQDELRKARHSVGIGVNGLAVGVAYILWQIGLQEANWSTDLLWRAAAWALLAALLLEAANYLFLAKRQRMTHVSEEIESAETDARMLRQRLRDATRV